LGCGNTNLTRPPQYDQTVTKNNDDARINSL
jgi:hypothetical protein